MIQTSNFWLLLLCSVLIYWQLPIRFRDGFLALASYIYLASLEPVVASVLILWTLFFFYLTPHAIAEKQPNRLIVPGLIIGILGYLFYYKYFPTLVGLLPSLEFLKSPIVPLGISYFTFKLIHYGVEVVRGNITDRSLSRFFCYIFLYPIFTAGPIERFDHFLANREESWQRQSMVEGATRIVHGLIKLFVIGKLLIGQLLQPWVTEGAVVTSLDLVTQLGSLQTHEVWGYLALAFLYAYIEFSAYSDIAIGASRLYGFRIMENFHFPILACNIGEFWKRWHMTLVGWIQRYIYMPTIGLTRSPYAAVYSTFLTMGLWHGATLNWIFWGLYHATGVSMYLTWGRIKRKRGWHTVANGPWKYAGIPLTFVFVTGSYAFSATSGHGGWTSLRVFAKLLGYNLGLNPLH
jgi:alginate O-acetyltransferase complex protein AlgI